MHAAPQLKEFISATQRLSPFRFLAGRGSNAVIVAEGDLYPALEKYFRGRFPVLYPLLNTLRKIPFLPYLGTSWLPKRFDPPVLLKADAIDRYLPVLAKKRPRAFFACSLIGEKRLRTRIREWVGQKKIVGLVGDALTERAAKFGKSPWHRKEIMRQAKHFVGPKSSYAVVCTPRSGSTYLCNLIANNEGFLEADEHLKPFVLFFYKYRDALNFNIMKWARFVLTAHTHDKTGIFGTKLISDFIFLFEKRVSEEDGKKLLELVAPKDTKIIYLKRKGKEEQAISAYLASMTNVWHVKGEIAKAKARRAKGKVKYDFEEIYKRQVSLEKNEVRLEKLLASSGFPIKYVEYESLVENTRSELAGILEWISPDFDPEKFVISTNLERVSRKIDDGITERYMSDVKALRGKVD